ncbi:MAG: RNA polymerase sigma factor [Gammaproteobacteria bacterium]|nr:RNA polymerase sigma factor [Gammaproteobacteria bacterium]
MKATDSRALSATGKLLRRQLSDQRQRLFGIALSWCHDRMLAEDLVQETLLRALDRLDSLRDQSRFEVWVTRIMLNLYRDMHRRKSPVLGIDFDIESDVDGPDREVERLATVRRVRSAVKKLGEQQRQVLSLVDIAEFSYSDAASILNVPIGTVMSRLCRARRSLRSALEAEERVDWLPVARVVNG